MAALVTCTDLIIDETTGAGVFTVRLFGTYTGSVVVNYQLYSGMASEGSNINYDFSGADGSLTFSGGATTQTVNFNIFNDAGVESFETFYLRLSSVTNASLAKEIYAATIIDNDTLASTSSKANLSVRDVIVDEQAGTASFDLVLDRATSSNFSVNYSTASQTGSATAGSDFTAASGVVDFTAGQTTKRVTVNILNDATEEGNEFFFLTLSDLSGSSAGHVQIADATGTAFIGRNDQAATATPMVYASDLVVSEADGYADFTVWLSSPSSGETAVDYTLYGGQASEYTNSNYDFNGADGRLIFANGVTTQNVRIEINENITAEYLETLYLSLSGVTGGTLARKVIAATIVDNDAVADAGNVANLSVRDVVLDEKAGFAVFDLVLDRATSSNFTVNYSTATHSGTATAGSDFTASSGSVTFAAGQTVQHVVLAIADDATEEGIEFFNLTLDFPSGPAADAGHVQIADGMGTAFIGRNDQTAVASPVVYASDIIVSEADGYGEFVVSLSAPSSSTTTVDYTLYSGLASEYTNSNYDFNGADGTLVFASGVTTQKVRFEINENATAESLESLYLRLSSVSNGSAARSLAVATIVDNDTLADSTNKANLSIRDVVVDEKAGVAIFDLVLDRATSSNFTVSYNTATHTGTATAGADFTASSGLVTFAAGQTTQRVTVAITDDTVEEGSEIFHLTLGELSGTAGDAGLVQIADGMGTAIIGRNDQTVVATPVIYASDIVVSEAEGYAEFVVSLSAPSSGTTSVNYSLYSGLASEYAGTNYDFNGADGTLVFANGVTTQKIRFEINENSTPETLESLYLGFGSVTNGTLARTDYVATIVDNDTVADTSNKANLSVRDVVVDEKAGIATFDLILDRATSSNFTVNYSTATNPGTATADADFAAASASVTFAAGQTVQHVMVSITDDNTPEASEFFNLTLGALSGSAADAGHVRIADGVGTALIGSNDQTAVAAPAVRVSDIVIAEGDGYAEFVVSLSAPSSGTTTVNYSLGGWAAYEYTSSTNDFNGPDGTLVFANGVTTQKVRFEINENTTPEALESLYLSLGSITNGALERNNIVATIVDNDTVADATNKASLSVRDVYIDEKAGIATFDLILDRATSGNFAVNYSTATQTGTAAAGADFVAASGTVNFAAGQTVQHVSVAINDDALAEGIEYFNLTLSQLAGSAVDAGHVQIADGMATAFIGANDQTSVTTPVVYCRDIVVSEADGYAEFVVSLSAPSTGTTEVAYQFSSGQASSSDFSSSSGTLRFANGVTTQKIRFEISADTSEEMLESLVLGFTSVTAGVLAREEAVATIVDNDRLADSGAPTNLSVRDVQIDEAAGIATFAVVADRVASDSFSVAYATANSTALAGEDYVAATGTLTFAAGETVKYVHVDITNDLEVELQEGFWLTLGDVTGGAADRVRVGDGAAQAIIGRSDLTALTTPSITVNDPVVGESDGYVDFVISLTAPGTQSVKVAFATSTQGGTASTSDFSSRSSDLIFEPGVTTQTVRIPINNDVTVETVETFSLLLSNATNATIGKATGVARIIDNDTAADTGNKGNLTVLDVTVNENAGTATVAVLLDKAASDSFSIAYATSNGSAVSVNDYVSATGQLTFAPGETTKSVTLFLIDDNLTELDETFTFSLGSISGGGAGQVQIADQWATVTVTNDDFDLVAPLVSSFSPADEAMGVAVDSNIVVTFNEAVQRGTGNIVLKTAAGTVIATYDAATSSNLAIVDKVLTINPTLNLGTGTAYQVAFAAGSIKDLSGNAYAGTNNYNFSTYAPPQSVSGSLANDRLNGGYGNDSIFGGDGTDTAVYLQRQAAYSVGGNASTRTVNGPEGNDSLASVERLAFSDSHLAFDLDGNAGQIYRLYKSAFARTPDLSGLGSWIGGMDNGQTLEQVASAFVSSGEFESLYGTSTSSEDFVTLLYLNVMGRAPDAGGLGYWANEISSGVQTRAQVLAKFSESGENKAAVEASIAKGILYASGDQAVVASQGLIQQGTADADALYGSVGKDTLTGLAGNDLIHGGAGVDTAVYAYTRANYTVTPTATGLTVSGGGEGTDTLTDVERLKFSDGVLAFDVTGNAGQVYRLYQAAFDRTPDTAGLSDWVRGMDAGMTLHKVASGFIGSAEFQGKYGASPSDDTFVNLLYQNVLKREADAGGKAYWLDELDRGMSREMALIGFSESAENQATVIGVIGNGINLTLA